MWGTLDRKAARLQYKSADIHLALIMGQILIAQRAAMVARAALCLEHPLAKKVTPQHLAQVVSAGTLGTISQTRKMGKARRILLTALAAAAVVLLQQTTIEVLKITHQGMLVMVGLPRKLLLSHLTLLTPIIMQALRPIILEAVAVAQMRPMETPLMLAQMEEVAEKVLSRLLAFLTVTTQ
jgi:hypothetical protein